MTFLHSLLVHRLFSSFTRRDGLSVYDAVLAVDLQDYKEGEKFWKVELVVEDYNDECGHAPLEFDVELWRSEDEKSCDYVCWTFTIPVVEFGPRRKRARRLSFS